MTRGLTVGFNQAPLTLQASRGLLCTGGPPAFFSTGGGAAGAVNPIGTNIGGPALDYEGFPLFQNRVIESRGFTQVSSPSTVTTLDTYGNPKTDFLCILSECNIWQTWMAGTWSCGFLGTGTETITAYGGCTVTKTSGASTTVAFNLVPTTNTTGAFGFQVTGTTSGTVNNYANLPGYSAGSATFTNEAITYYSQFAHLRWMEWSNVIFNEQAMTGSNRNTPSNTKNAKGWFSTAEGYPLDWAAQFCAACNTGGWFCMPVNDDGTYVAAIASMLYTTMPAGKPIYIEIGNELWNGVGPGTDLFPTQASNAGLTEAQYLAYRLHQAAVAFQSVFGARFTTDVNLVMAWQAGGNGLNILSAALSYMNTTYGPPSNFIKYLSTAPYMTRNNTNVPSDGTNHISVNDTVAAIETQLTANGTYQAYFSSSENISVTGQYYGLKLIAYESGWEIGGENSTPTNIGAANLDSGMTAVMENYYKTLFGAGFDVVTYFDGGVDTTNSNKSPEYKVANNWNTLVNTGMPKLTALQYFTAGTIVPTRNVVSASGSNFSGANFCDNFTSSFQPLNGSAFTFGPHYGTGGYVPFELWCTAPGTYSLVVEFTSTSSGQTNVEVNGSVVHTGVAISNSLTNGPVTLGNVTLKAGKNYLVLGDTTYQPNIVATLLTFN